MFGDPGTGVCDRHLDPPSVAPASDSHPASRWGVGEGVAEQIHDHLGEPIGIARYRQRWEFHGQHDLLVVELRPKPIGGLPHYLSQVDRIVAHGGRLVDAGKGRQVSGETLQPGGLLGHRSKGLHLRGNDSIDEALHESFNGRERGAQLVGDVGDQLQPTALGGVERGGEGVDVGGQCGQLLLGGKFHPVGVVTIGEAASGGSDPVQRPQDPPGHERGHHQRSSNADHHGDEEGATQRRVEGCFDIRSHAVHHPGSVTHVDDMAVEKGRRRQSGDDDEGDRAECNHGEIRNKETTPKRSQDPQAGSSTSLYPTPRTVATTAGRWASSPRRLRTLRM